MPVATQVTVEQAMGLGMHHYNEGNLMVADRAFRDILAAIPDYHPAVHHLGLVCFYRGDIKGAVEHTGRSVTLDPENARYLNNYAVMLSEDGQKEKALRMWDQAIKAEPGFSDSYSNKANTLWQLKRFEEAAAHAEKAIELNPKYPDAYLNLGNALVAMRKLDEAIKCWRRAIKVKPDFDKAWSNIGNALREQGDLKGSEEACARAVEINPNNPQAWSNLGNARRDLGNPKAAEECYRKSAALLPSYADAHNNLAVCLIDQHRFEDALAAVRYAIAFRPDYAEAYANLSLIQRELGNLEDAETAAQRAITLNPESASHYLDLSDILFMGDRFDEAQAALEKARHLSPDSPRVLLKLGMVLERANQPEEALKIFDQALEMAPDFLEIRMRKAGVYFLANMLDEAEETITAILKLKPDHAPAYGTLSEIHQSRGDMDKSLKAIRKALKFSKNSPQFYFSLAKCKKFTKNDPDLKAMEEALDNKKIGKLGMASLHFALFEAYEDIGDYRKAFEHLKKGNDLKRSTVVYKPEHSRLGFEIIRKTYTKSYLASFRGKGCESPMPIFIIGMPRSGTTLTEQILSSHPAVFGAGELTTLSQIERDFPLMTPDNAAKMGQSYIDRVLARFPEIEKGKHTHFTDKMPGNFIRIGQIASILPHAKIIHCRRDPVDTCLSNYKQMFARGQYWSYDLEEMAEHYRLYEEIMKFWRKMLPHAFIEVDYEDTVSNLEKQARRMVDFVGLPWDEACLAPHEQKRTVLTASKTQVIQPVYKSSVKAWKRYKKELQPLIKGLGDLADAGGKKSAPVKKSGKKAVAKKKPAAKKKKPVKTKPRTKAQAKAKKKPIAKAAAKAKRGVKKTVRKPAQKKKTKKR